MKETVNLGNQTTEVIVAATQKITRKYIMNGKAEEAAEINEAALIVAEGAIKALHQIVIALSRVEYELAMDLVGKIAAATYLTGVSELIKNRQAYENKKTPNPPE